MIEKWQTKYRFSSARLPHYDYRANGAYFITICTHHQVHFFGECHEGQMKLSTIGAIVQGFWYEIPKHFSFVALGEFVVMPNHIHGVLILDNHPVETLHRNVYENDEDVGKNEFFSKISPNAGSISTIIRSYKAICSKHIHLAFPQQNFKWQARFHDHVIRNEQAYETISNYIINNPLTWENDKFNPQ